MSTELDVDAIRRTMTDTRYSNEHIGSLARGVVPALLAALDASQEKCDWWRDMMTALTALVDSHYMLPSPIDDSARLRQVQTELHDMGAEWDTEWRSTNQGLWERAEAAEAALVAVTEERDRLLAENRGLRDAFKSFDEAKKLMEDGRGTHAVWQQYMTAHAVLSDPTTPEET